MPITEAVGLLSLTAGGAHEQAAKQADRRGNSRRGTLAMGNRIFVSVIVLFWAATMSWLVIDKILPPFFHGEPPKPGMLRDEPVCWDIACSGREIGFAVSQVVPGALDTTEIHSRVLLDGVPLSEMAPQWMSSLVGSLGHVRLDTRTRLTLDSLGNLAAFDTKVKLNGVPSVVKIYGRVEGPDLVLTLQSGEIVHKARYPVPSSALLGSELIPEPKLLQVYVGRRWQKEMFSPFRPPGSTMELIQAEVVGEESIVHDGDLSRVRRIEYSSLFAAGVSTSDRMRAVLWVAEDGTVLRHDLHLMNVKLRFERRDDPATLEKGERLLDLGRVATLTAPSDSP